MQTDRPTIPKFASFRPKGKPEPALNADKSRTTSAYTEAKHQRKQRSRSKDRHRRHHRSRSRERGVGSLVEASLATSDTLDEDIGLFVTDRRGDPDNLVYGKIHRYSIPLFRRRGAGSVLGLPVHIKIDRYADEDKGILVSDHRGSRKREKYTFARNESKSIKKLRILPDSDHEL